MINHSERLTRQCARIWSDNLQLPCVVQPPLQLPYITFHFHMIAMVIMLAIVIIVARVMAVMMVMVIRVVMVHGAALYLNI